jgi:di/tricarboxylate transporter
MTIAGLSFAALVVTILASCTVRINAGVLALVLAWLVGMYAAGMTVAEVAAGFPVQLFLTLGGVTYLFALAQANGTMDRLTRYVVSCAPPNRGLLPVIFFGFAWLLSTIGPGAIGAAALVFPMAMAAAERARIPAFLMSVMICNGANAGNLAPFSPAGVIVQRITEQMGMQEHYLTFYLYNFLVHALVGFGGYLLFGGWRLLGDAAAPASASTDDVAFAPAHALTLGVIGALLLGVVFLGLDAGMMALAGAGLLTVAGAASERSAIRGMPWGVVLMVCGVSTLVALLERTGGLDLLTGMLARVATPATAPALGAFAAGLLSAYSSTSGVVLPAFLPTVAPLVEKLGGGDPVGIAASMTIGAQLSDVSPLSALGALCIAGAAAYEDPRALFNNLLAWGLSMSLVGAALCYVLFSVF